MTPKTAACVYDAVVRTKLVSKATQRKLDKLPESERGVALSKLPAQVLNGIGRERQRVLNAQLGICLTQPVTVGAFYGLGLLLPEGSAVPSPVGGRQIANLRAIDRVGTELRYAS